MRSVEVEGDSIDHAIQKALSELGVARDRAAIEILNDASRGILGFGGRKARVRASVRAPLSATLAQGCADGSLESRAVDAASRVSRETRPPDVATRRVSPRTPEKPAAPAGGLAPNIADPPSATASPRPGGAATSATEPRAARTGGSPGAGDSAAPASELASRAQGTLRELLGHLGVDGEVSVRSDTDAGAAVVGLAVRGRDSALLIGKRGQTLDAIEYLLNRMLVREPGSNTRIEVDVEEYRARREESLVAMARRTADKVRKTGRPATVDLLSPRDRRVVHLALREEPGVTSRSQGDGYLRKLVIVPEGRRRNGPRPTRDGE